MATKVFISYSHKDESFKDDLIEHMSNLKRSGIISEWNDRKIIPGADWSKDISENLKNSDLILYLVSSSFLASEYCVNIEAKTALQMHQDGKAQLIPIVIRPVDWSDSAFSKLQGLPKDAQPISSWENKDEAWLNVIGGIKYHIGEFLPNNAPPPLITHDDKGMATTMLDWLDDTEITLTHRNVDKIRLSQIYTVPDVELYSAGKNEIKKFESACKLIPQYKKLLISGEEQQGKTSLLKHYYQRFLKDSICPLYLEGSNIKNDNLEAMLRKEIKNQFEELSFDDFMRMDNKAILIDNIDNIPLNLKHRNIFISAVSDKFDICIFTLKHSFSLLVNEIPLLDDFEKAELLGLGNTKREEIIKKWISLGIEQTISEEDLYKHCDELKDAINVVVRKNIVPPKPIYILMLLQMLEAHSKLNLELSSHGHCYQQLIYQSFENAKIDKPEYDKYLNVLTELAWWIFTKEQKPNEFQLEQFFGEYSKEFLEVDSTTVIQKLTNHSILEYVENRTGFKYPYIYYFFVGKKIAESYSESDEVKVKVQYLLDNLHREDNANILIFVSHHTKDKWVIDTLQSVLSNLFEDQPPATLEKEQLSFMNQFMKQIPELILEQRDVQKERDKHNQRLDLKQRQTEEPTDEESIDILANINKTFKGMEIAGQIIKNRHASLKKDSLTILAENGINAGLRFLKYFIAISHITKKEILKVISSHLSENPTVSNSEIERHAENAYLFLTYGVINSVVRKIASSVGSKEAMEIYNLIETKAPTPAILLLKQSIELQFLKKIDIKGITKSVEELKENPVCSRILKELIVQHIYMFPVNYKEKQQLSSLLGLTTKRQHLMEQKQKKIS